jgi:hypothetical protein
MLPLASIRQQTDAVLMLGQPNITRTFAAVAPECWAMNCCTSVSVAPCTNRCGGGSTPTMNAPTASTTSPMVVTVQSLPSRLWVTLLRRRRSSAACTGLGPARSVNNTVLDRMDGGSLLSYTVRVQHCVPTDVQHCVPSPSLALLRGQLHALTLDIHRAHIFLKKQNLRHTKST